MDTITIAATSPARWVSFSADPAAAAKAEKMCDASVLQQALTAFPSAKVVSASVNRSGRHVAAPLSYALSLPTMAQNVVVEDLPAFCDIEVALEGAGGHVASIMIWVPLDWNGRFLGTVGGGNRTDASFGFPEIMRTLTMPTALRNGFATAKTDGANRKVEFADWGLVDGTDQIEWELTDNWVHRSTHEMTLIAKAIVEAIHGKAPVYSYAAGCSGGGRQVLEEAQRYPGDYDGIWASDSAINYNRFIPAELWPVVVMNEHGVVAPAKFDAFRAAVIDAFDGIDGLRDGIVGAFDPCDFDPRQLIGTVTEAGEITEADAVVVKKIWEGPRTRDGEFLWYGLHPAVESWGSNIFNVGLCCTVEVDGRLEPKPFEIALAYIRCWLVRDRKWDWRTATFEDYERLFAQSVTEFAEIATDNPDLTAFRDGGGKIIISHGSGDTVIPYQGSVDYYRRVIEQVGTEEDTRAFARLFISEGDGHGLFNVPGPGLVLADGMAALMRWVELGEAPDELPCKSLDMSGATIATRPVYAYPMVPAYRGEGDGNDAASFAPVHYTERA